MIQMRRITLLIATVLLMNSFSFVSAQRAKDLLALYTFKEGSGATVKDVSDFGEPLDLTIEKTANVKWVAGGGLVINESTLIASDSPATKIIDACKVTNEITIEAWVKPANKTNAGPARIVTLSADASNRNFTLGQDTVGYQIRLRTTTTGNNGVNPFLAIPNAVVTDTTARLVYVRDESEKARFYIDGKQVGEQDVTGNFSNWDASYKFGLGHELNKDEGLGRFWLGEYTLVAIYSRAFTPDELMSDNLLAVEFHGKLAVAWAKIKIRR
jgi:hypothetical protein